MIFFSDNNILTREDHDATEAKILDLNVPTKISSYVL
jgi:hypothetical protein